MVVRYVTRRMPSEAALSEVLSSRVEERPKMAHPQHALPVVESSGEIRPVVRAPAIERWSWALYDFSNTIFSMNVATLYFSVWIVSDLKSTDLVYAMANAVASILMVIAIPLLG